MSYLVLARKYRPQTFSEIVGQQHIVTTLKNALKSGKVWHAYIFAGMRGTGKTTTARVLAKALNCLSPTEDFEPCNKCENCLSIIQGSSVDVIEIDAASNRGIDDIRSLRETVKYVPVHSRYKVYIIDEAHQITDAAFNAFLKTLEEPPSYVVFILATTEFNALPLTIISRCQVFKFKPVSSNVIFERLKYIVTQESKEKKITDDALKLIAESSSGSVRDALSLLDHILSYTEIYDVVDANIVREIFGITPDETIEKYVELLIESDVKKILNYINEIYYSGVDLYQFSKDLLEFFRNLLYIKNSSNYEFSYYSVAKKFEDKFSLNHIMSSIQQMLRLTEEIKRAEYPKTLFELYTIKLTQQYIYLNELLNELEKKEESQPQTVSTSQELEKTKTEKIQKEEKKQEFVSAQLQERPLATENFSKIWDEVLEIIRKEKPLSYTIISSSEVVLNNDILYIYLPNKYTKIVLESHNLNLSEILEQFLKRDIKVIYDVKQNKLVFEEPQPSSSPQSNFIAIKPKKQIDPTVEKIRAAFSGKIIEKQKTQQDIEEEI